MINSHAKWELMKANRIQVFSVAIFETENSIFDEKYEPHAIRTHDLVIWSRLIYL